MRVCSEGSGVSGPLPAKGVPSWCPPSLKIRGRRPTIVTAEGVAHEERLVEHLARSGFVIFKRPLAMGGATLRRGSDGGASYKINRASGRINRPWRLGTDAK